MQKNIEKTFTKIFRYFHFMYSVREVTYEDDMWFIPSSKMFQCI